MREDYRWQLLSEASDALSPPSQIVILCGGGQMKRTEKTKRPLISVVTPVYSAERILPELYRRLIASLETITRTVILSPTLKLPEAGLTDRVAACAKKGKKPKRIKTNINLNIFAIIFYATPTQPPIVLLYQTRVCFYTAHFLFEDQKQLLVHSELYLSLE